MRSLYEISEELLNAMREAEAEAEQNEGEISEILNVKLDALEVEKELKIGNVCRFYKSLLAEADMVKAEAKKLSERASATENKAKSLKWYLSNVIKEGEKFADEHTKISWRKSTSIKAEEDVTFYPEKYHKCVISLDKMGMKTDLKNGINVEGAVLIEKQNIQIK